MKPSNINQVVAYIRVSTAEQAENGYSIDAQQHEIEKFCKNKGFLIKKIFTDAGISGTDITKRTEFKNMMNFLHDNEDIDAVVSWGACRIARSVVDFANTINTLEDLEVALFTIKEPLDTSSANGKIFAFMSSVFAEFDRNNIVRNGKLGMQQRAREGKWNGGQVFGYDSVDKQLVINEEEAVTVREIFTLFADGKGYKAIANALNHKISVSKTKKGRHWSINSIKTIIDNPIYVGYIRWGQHTNWSKKRRQEKDKDFILSKGEHQAIISEELWEQAVAIRDERGKQMPKVYEGNFLLTGLLKCPVCKASMVSQRSKKRNKEGYYRYYACGNFVNKGSSVCKANLVCADSAEHFVVNQLFSISQKPAIIDKTLEEAQKGQNSQAEPLQKELVLIQKSISQTKGNRENYFAQIEGEIPTKFSQDTLIERINKCEERIVELKTKLSELEFKLSQISNNNQSSKALKEVLLRLPSFFHNTPVPQQKRLLHSLVNEIKVLNGNSPSERRIDSISLFFDFNENSLGSSPDMFEATYGTVHPD